MSVGQFEHENVRFQFPENWTVQEQTAELRQLAVTVESPNGSFWSLQCLGPEVHPQHAADQALEAIEAEYDPLESTAIQDEFSGLAMLGYEVDFYCLDLVIEAQIRSFVAEGETYLLLFQAENRDFSELQPVFSAITLSLVRSLLGE